MKFQLNWTVCRVCLTEGDGLSTIYERDDSEMLICDKIIECGGITISREKNLPEEICKKCLAFLSVAHKFRTMCKNSDEILQTFVEKKLESKLIPGLTSVSYEDESSEIKCDVEEIATEDDIVDSNVIIYDGEDIIDEDSVESNVQEEDVKFDIATETEVIEKKKTLPRKSKKRILKRKPVRPTSKTLAMESDGTPIIKYRNLDEKPLHVCEMCGNIYKRRHALDNHMRWHRKEKPFDCEICGVAFGLNTQLTRHMRRHTGQKPYECQYCGRKFSDLGTKTKHERIHTGERPFKCQTCGKTFTYSHVLNVHLLTHTGEKRYSCEQCGKRFSQPHHLKAHLSTLIHQKLETPTTVTNQAADLDSNIIVEMNPSGIVDDSETSNVANPSVVDLGSDSSNAIHLFFAS